MSDDNARYLRILIGFLIGVMLNLAIKRWL